MCVPSLRARAAGTASSKNSHTCAPLPDRERSMAAGRSSWARLGECGRILAPSSLVEIRRQKEARLIEKHRINPGHERLAGVVVAGQMPPDRVIRDRQEALVRTLCASDPRFFADPADPLIAACRCIPRLSRLPALETSRVNVFTTRKRERNSAIFACDGDCRWTLASARSSDITDHSSPGTFQPGRSCVARSRGPAGRGAIVDSCPPRPFLPLRIGRRTSISG
jgi:hypothetical protein